MTVNKSSGINYNPDVLSCLSNLSNDEVFTPPSIVNAMLDLLPQELFRNPETTFLDPVCKSGVFLREITKRLIAGLADTIPNLEKRVEHILHHQVFGIAITELTSLMSRRTLYCSKYPNGPFSVTEFDNIEGNIKFRNLCHTWENGKCVFCGVAEGNETYNREGKEVFAYEFIHTDKPEEIFDNMKFDVIVGNPPYQLNVGVEKENYAIPIYQKFVEQAKKLNPRYLTMIIPARWYAGGRGLDEFRDKMLHDNQLCIIHDYPDASDCFPGVQIKAGVCYFLWRSGNHSDCQITTHLNGDQIGPLTRPLLEQGSDIFIRYNQAISVLHKVYSKRNKSFSGLISPQTPFGILTSYKGNIRKQRPSDVKMFISGNEKQFKGSFSYAPVEKITRGHEMVQWHKVFIPKAGSGSDSFPHMILGSFC